MFGFSYGQSSVWKAETQEDRDRIWVCLVGSLKDMGEDCIVSYKENPSEQDITRLILEFGGLDYHEVLEYGTGFNTVIGEENE